MECKATASNCLLFGQSSRNWLETDQHFGQMFLGLKRKRTLMQSQYFRIFHSLSRPCLSGMIAMDATCHGAVAGRNWRQFIMSGCLKSCYSKQLWPQLSRIFWNLPAAGLMFTPWPRRHWMMCWRHGLGWAITPERATCIKQRV